MATEEAKLAAATPTSPDLTVQEICEGVAGGELEYALYASFRNGKACVYDSEVLEALTFTDTDEDRAVRLQDQQAKWGPTVERIEVGPNTAEDLLDGEISGDRLPFRAKAEASGHDGDTTLMYQQAAAGKIDLYMIMTSDGEIVCHWTEPAGRSLHRKQSDEKRLRELYSAHMVIEMDKESAARVLERVGEEIPNGN